jgi:hypothetical protein
MKSKSLIFILFLSLVTIACCSKNDDEIREDETLYGIWNLSRSSGGLSGYEKFSPGEVVWTFNEEDNNLVVENNFEGDEFQVRFTVLSDGTYDYEVMESGDYQILFVDGEKLGSLHLEPGILRIDGGQALDGPLYEFER